MQTHSPSTFGPADAVRRTARWLRRIGHCAGFGIQSPFAFGLVTQVVYEHTPFYAYTALARSVDHAAEGLRLKDARLLLRLANAHQPQSIVVVGTHTAAAQAYLGAGKPSARMVATTATDATSLASAVSAAGGAQLLYVGADAWPAAADALLPLVGQRTLIVVHGMGRSRAGRQAWRRLLSDERARVAFDLHDFGLVCCTPRLQPARYVVNYF